MARNVRTVQTNRFVATLVAAASLFAASQMAHAQARPATRDNDALVRQQRRIRDEVWAQIDRESPIAEDFAVDYGGAYSFNLFIYDDGFNSSRTLRQHDLRLWTRMSMGKGAHEIYARTKLSFFDFNSGDSIDGRGDDWQGPNLERGFYQFDLKRAMQTYADQQLDYNVRVKIGRDLVNWGSGLTLSQRLDHLSVEATASDLQVTGMLGRTVGSDVDIDTSRPLDRTRRAVFGVQMKYIGFEDHEPFAYALWQRDHNDETIWTPLQRYDYDSFYFGLGSTGELISNLQYTAEWVYESGHSYGHQRFLRENVIRAWALNLRLDYYFRDRHRSRASAEYLFASGDSDRTGSPTNTLGGNRGDFDDTSFVSLGWRDTGMSFAPQVSNLHMWRAGATFYPFPGEGVLDRLELGTNWFLYWKNHRSGAVSDPLANQASGYLGWEMDYFANWAITSDLTWTMRYGVFFPGSAFADQTTRTFAVTGLTWSF